MFASNIRLPGKPIQNTKIKSVSSIVLFLTLSRTPARIYSVCNNTRHYFQVHRIELVFDITPSATETGPQKSRALQRVPVTVVFPTGPRIAKVATEHRCEGVV